MLFKALRAFFPTPSPIFLHCWERYVIQGKSRLPCFKLSQARVHFARREYALSLGTFQKVLLLSPLCKPDPRIGIGLCLWHLNSHERAVAAWERSLEVVSCVPVFWRLREYFLESWGLGVISHTWTGRHQQEQRYQATRPGSCQSLPDWFKADREGIQS